MQLESLGFQDRGAMPGGTQVHSYTPCHTPPCTIHSLYHTLTDQTQTAPSFDDAGSFCGECWSANDCWDKSEAPLCRFEDMTLDGNDKGCVALGESVYKSVVSAVNIPKSL